MYITLVHFVSKTLDSIKTFVYDHSKTVHGYIIRPLPSLIYRIDDE
jgi:hypothetical protein